MKASMKARNPIADVQVYRDFMRLDRERRRRTALRILRNQKMLGDLYDHFLIQRSLDEPGQNVAWEPYTQSCVAGKQRATLCFSSEFA